MLSGGMVGRGEGKKWRIRLALKGAVPVFSSFPVFLGLQFDLLPVFDGLTLICTRGGGTQAMPGISPTIA